MEKTIENIENNLNELEARALLNAIVEKKNESTWTREQETLVRQWVKPCENLKNMHRLSSEYFNQLNSLLSYPVVILSSVIGISGFAIIKFEKPSLHEIVLQYVFSTGNVIISVLSSVAKFMNCKEKSEKHYEAFSRFAKLCRLIRVELSLPPKSRKNAYTFVDELKDEVDKLYDIGLGIPKHIRARMDNVHATTTVFSDTQLYVSGDSQIDPAV